MAGSGGGNFYLLQGCQRMKIEKHIQWKKKQEMYEYATGQQKSDTVNLGMDVTVPTNREIRFQYLTCFMEISKESFSHFLW